MDTKFQFANVEGSGDGYTEMRMYLILLNLHLKVGTMALICFILCLFYRERGEKELR